MTPSRKTASSVLAGGLAVALLSGCQFSGAASLPLPGGEATGKDAYVVQVEFPDVLDLVPQSAVKVDDVTVGSVSKIELKGYTAVVTVRVRNDVKLPANATAALRQTSLLGEKFVALQPPQGQAPQGQLRGGAVIGLNRTSRNVEIEELLSALSLVLNGGSLEQVQVINKELVAALKGREGKVRDLLIQLNTFVGGLDKQKGQIIRALDSMDRLTARLAKQRQVLAVALDDIPNGAKVLSDQRAELTKVLVGLDRLGKVAIRVINGSKQNTVADLKALEPILGQLNAAGVDLPKALELLTTYPFPRTIDTGIRGDYANLFVTLDGDLGTLSNNLGLPKLPTSGPTLPGLPVPTPSISGLPVPLPTGSLPSLPVNPLAPNVQTPTVPPPNVPVPVPAPGLTSGPGPGGTVPGGVVPSLGGGGFTSLDQGGLNRLLLGGLS